VGAYNKAKEGVDKAVKGLTASINDISKNEYIKANKAFQKAVNDLLNCLGFDSLF